MSKSFALTQPLLAPTEVWGAAEPNTVYLIQPRPTVVGSGSRQNMKQLIKVLSVLAMAASLLGCIAAPIEMTPQTEQALRAQPPIRFLLTFDDGPSASSFWNPTETVLDSLAINPVQPGIKAVFFVQTRASRAGASDIGRAVMHRERDAGHILAFHTATPSHTNHRSLNAQELEQALTDGCADIAAITGAPPTL